MAHSLQADGIEGGCKRREIVDDEEILDQHAGDQDSYADNEDAYATVKQDAAQHHGERKEGKSANVQEEGFFQKIRHHDTNTYN